jgi:dolichyl-phosphate beta-glucosyltransferase
VPEPIALSVILPAYNEAARLPPHLAAVRQYLQARYPDRYEVIVVDDGSGDGLAGALDGLAAAWPQLCVIRHAQNQGKGAAVRTGMLAARGELLLFADADGATPIDEESRLAAAIGAGADLAVGSRLVAAAGMRRSRTWLRGLAGRLFAASARRLLRLSVRDTQCGFKMFRRDVGRRLFSMLREPRYLFDLEVLALACRLGYRTAEVAISWREVPGGKFKLSQQFPKVLVDLWRLWRRLRNQPGQ